MALAQPVPVAGFSNDVVAATSGYASILKVPGAYPSFAVLDIYVNGLCQEAVTQISIIVDAGGLQIPFIGDTSAGNGNVPLNFVPASDGRRTTIRGLVVPGGTDIRWKWHFRPNNVVVAVSVSGLYYAAV